jgi:hypothetical protein
MHMDVQADERALIVRPMRGGAIMVDGLTPAEAKLRLLEWAAEADRNSLLRRVSPAQLAAAAAAGMAAMLLVSIRRRGVVSRAFTLANLVRTAGWAVPLAARAATSMSRRR